MFHEYRDPLSELTIKDERYAQLPKTSLSRL